MNAVWQRLLPKTIDNRTNGRKLPVIFFALYTLLSLVRSCIHLLVPDGGAGSIAGMDLTVEGAQGIVFAFALWGSAQLLLAVIQLVAVWRYRSLIPFLYLLVLVETGLRMLVGQTRTASFAHTPPGAIGNLILPPLVLVMLVLSLLPEKE
jgi:hypothetical protein